MTIITTVILFLFIFPTNNSFAKSKYTEKLKISDLYLVTGMQSYNDLKKNGFKPRKDIGPWKYSFPIDWSADPFKDNNWKFQKHAWRMVDPILAEFKSTGDVKFLKESINYAIDWSNYHNKNKPTPFSWYDMAVGIRAMKIAFFLDLIYSGKVNLDQPEVTILEKLGTEHARELQQVEKISLGNHGVFQMVGLKQLCSVLSNEESCHGAIEFSEKMYSKIFNLAYTQEGVHKEHSPSYHFFMNNLVSGLALKAFPNNQRLSTIEKAKAIEPMFVFPNGVIAPVGDSSGRRKPLTQSDKFLESCLDDGQCFALGDYTSSGYAIIRSLPNDRLNESMLFITGMAYSITHKHADDLSFTLYEFDRFIFIDSGKYSYNIDKYRNYIRSAAAHNTISLEDNPILYNTTIDKGTHLVELKNTGLDFVIKGKIVRDGLYSQKRIFKYIPGKFLIIDDQLISKKNQRYVSSLHLAPGLNPEIAENGFTVTIKGEGVIKASLKTSEDCAIEKIKGQEEPVLGWVSESYNVINPTYVIRAICPGTSLSIKWEVQIQDKME